MALRVITLPVCPICEHVGALPRTVARKDYCNGGTRNSHKQVRMVPVKFKELRAPAETGAKS